MINVNKVSNMIDLNKYSKDFAYINTISHIKTLDEKADEEIQKIWEDHIIPATEKIRYDCEINLKHPDKLRDLIIKKLRELGYEVTPTLEYFIQISWR